MATGIKGVVNNSNQAVKLINHDNHGDDRTIPAGAVDGVIAWFPGSKEQAIEVITPRGNLRLWDHDWKIMFIWSGESFDQVYTSVHNGQDFQLVIDGQGNFSLQ